MQIIYILDLVGTGVFAISGMLTASEKKFDIFGGLVIGFITAVGGGTVRDILIGAHPVGWMQDNLYLLVIVLSVALGYFFKQSIQKLRRTFFLFDSIGIGIFTILGIVKTLSYGVSPIVAIMMGTVSAVFGGVLRDMLTHEIPLIFRNEIYATACILGGSLYLFLHYLALPETVVIISTMVFIIVLRILAVKRKWSLPRS